MDIFWYHLILGHDEIHGGQVAHSLLTDAILVQTPVSYVGVVVRSAVTGPDSSRGLRQLSDLL